METRMSIKATLEHARETVKCVQVAPGSFTVQSFDPGRQLWIEGSTQNYHAARATLTEARHAAALTALGYDGWDAACFAGLVSRGRLEDRVRATLARA